METRPLRSSLGFLSTWPGYLPLRQTFCRVRYDDVDVRSSDRTRPRADPANESRSAAQFQQSLCHGALHSADQANSTLIHRLLSSLILYGGECLISRRETEGGEGNGSGLDRTGNLCG